jgi:hypothetical protein
MIDVPRQKLHPVIAFDGESIVKMYIGNWSDYEGMMMEKLGKIFDHTACKIKSDSRFCEACDCHFF